MLPECINRRQPIVRRQRYELHTSAVEQLIGSDHECVGRSCKSCINLANVPGGQNFNLFTDRRGRRLQISGQGVGIAIIRIEQHGKACSPRKQLMQDSQPLGPKLSIHGADPGQVTAGTIEAGNETDFDRVRPTPKTIGTVAVTAFAASAAGVLAGVAITATPRCTRSRTNSGSRALSLYAKRNSTVTLRPSMKPASFKPLRNAATTPPLSSGTPGYTNPITGIVDGDCCAPAASGHAAIAPPSSVIKLRRFNGQCLPCFQPEG